MPYFDDRTYSISNSIREQNTIPEYAKEFYEKCMSLEYPKPIQDAMERALHERDINELIIMADATTGFAIHSEDAFRKIAKSNPTKDKLFDVICISIAAIFTYRAVYHRNAYYNSFLEDVAKAWNRYNDAFGKENLAFLNAFIEKQMAEITPAYEEDIRACRQAREDDDKRRRAEEEERKLKEEERAAEALRKQAAQQEQQRRRNEARQAEIELFRKKPLVDQLQTIVANPKRPAAYGIDYSTVTQNELRDLPKELLVNIITSFMNERDAGWKDLQKKAREILSA